MMRYTPSATSTVSSEPPNHETNHTPSRKRRSESSAQMFHPSASQENENIMNYPILDSTSSTADVTSNAIVEVNNSKSPVPTKVQLKVRIKRFHSVAHWTWGSNTHDDVCSICQNAFEGVCPGVKYPGEDCPVVWGKCLHAFHLQCINTWLTSSTATSHTANAKLSCPICRQEWEFRSSHPTSTTTTNATTTS
jgi:anaphase-promoting complex subunit 11